MLSALSVWALLVAVAQAGMYSAPVINLDAKTFKQALSTEHAAMVAFIAPWCGHCKSLGPEFSAAATSLSPLIPFYAIDCDEAGNKRLCAEYQVQGFPTIKAFPRALKGAPRDYNGERKRGALIDHAKGLVPDRVKKLRVDDGAEAAIGKFLGEVSAPSSRLRGGADEQKSNLPHALLIHPSNPSIPFLWKVLGQRLSSKMHVGYIKDSASHSVLSSLGIHDPADTARDATRAVYWPAGALRGQIVEYEGGFKFNPLLEWLQALVEGQTPPPPLKDDTKRQPVQAEPSASSTAGADAEAKAARQAELDRKAKLKAKMEEADRRDQARREKAAAKAAGAATTEQSPAGTGEEEASKVEAPKPEAEESVEEELLKGSSAADGIALNAQPQDEIGGGGAEVRETMVHEEL